RDLGDSSGDSRVFVEELARVCRDKHGVTIKLGTRVLALHADRERIDGIVTSSGLLSADNYVLALGVGAPIVARTAGVSLPIYPAKGYSSTFPLKTGGLAPTISGVDEQWLVGWSRLGDHLRLTSTAEFAGYDWSWTPRDFNNILRLARDLFPDAADYDRGQYRAWLGPVHSDTHVNPSMDVLLRYADAALRDRMADLAPYLRKVKVSPGLGDAEDQVQATILSIKQLRYARVAGAKPSAPTGPEGDRGFLSARTHMVT